MNQQDKPTLNHVLLPGEVFADLAVTRDRFPGTRSYLALASHDLEPKLTRCVVHYERHWQEYQAALTSITGLADFSERMVRLLTPPGP